MIMRPLITPVLANFMQSLEDWWTRMNFREVGRSTLAGHSDWLFFWIYAISTFFFVLLMVLMVYFTFKYRKRPGGVPERSRSHNTFLELSWSVIPTIILVWMFFEGFWGYTDAVMAPVEAQELVITASQWNWAILYPNGASSPESTRTRRMGPWDKAPASAGSEPRVEGATDSPIFVVPEGRPVSLRMSSKDVIHSFWIPDFRVKFDAFPNRFTSLWFQPTAIDPSKAGEATTKKGITYTYEDHWVDCAEYCGSNHSEMLAIIRVVPRDKYAQILEEWATPTGAPWQKGQFYYKAKGCNSCHTIDGSKNVGPSWKNMYGYPVQFSDGSSYTAEQMTGEAFANYVRESAYTPAAKIVAGFPNQMQSQTGNVSQEQLEDIMAFIKHLSDKGPPDAPDPDAAPGATGATGATPPGAPTGAAAAPKK